MKTNDEIESILTHLIDKLNRVEANVARIKSDPQQIKDAIDVAIEKLTAATSEAEPELPYQDVLTKRGETIRVYCDGTSKVFPRDR